MRGTNVLLISIARVSVSIDTSADKIVFKEQ